MSNVPMPPVWGSAINDAGDGHVDLITTDQAEAYADARVREALEQAARIIEANAAGCNETTFYILHSQIAAIRALIHSTPARPESEQCRGPGPTRLG